ncbi:MAG: FAD-dependent oxidoreductase [Dehalococcoidales bacterium]|nr:FAD-dependent oxidoreductase [Dehalococcoidales bacterium]
MSAKLKRLFKPGQIGGMTLKNRIVQPPMYTGYATDKGYVTRRLIDYYEARARGGVGLIIIEITAPYAAGRTYQYQLNIGDESCLPGFKDMVAAIHRHGAKVAVQLHHGGKEIRKDLTGNQPVAPSAVSLFGGEPPRELTVAEIAEITQAFAAAARRVKEAGCDGVEIHGAHQYLLSSFLSRATNLRTDAYGGTIENRARFLVEVLQAARKAVGADFPMWVRLSANEYGLENGITIEETQQVVPLAVAAGAQAIHVSAYGAGSYVMKASSPDEAGYFLPLAAEVKKVAKVPVIAVGRFDAELGEKVLAKGKADFISIGRRLIADPGLPEKAKAGKLKDVNPCIGCMECLERRFFAGEDTVCAINPLMGREGDYQLKPAAKAKKVVVVGGGPAGMQAALIAAQRGHKVTLLEKDAKLGGQLKVAAVPPFKADIVPFCNYLIRQVDKAGVQVKLNTTATADNIVKMKPETVVIAAGGIPARPEIPCAEGAEFIMATDVLAGRVKVGQNVVVIGGGMVGCEVAHFLAAQGKKVTVVEMLKRLAADMLPMVRRRRLDGLRAAKVNTLTSTTCAQINKGEVTVTTADGKSQSIPADSVVLAAGFRPNDSLLSELQGKVPEIYNIGDSAKVRHIMGATSEGYKIGLMI